MEKFLSHSAKILFGYMFYEMYNYYYFSKYESMMKKSINIDLSFEKIEDGILNKDVMIATSINNITKAQKQKNYFYLKSVLEGFDERNSILKFKLDEDDATSLKISLNHSNSADEKETGIKKIDELDLDLDKNHQYIYFDPPILKTIPIKDDNKIVKENHEKLSMIDKLKCILRFRNSKRILNVHKGFILDQKLLIYGNIIKNEANNNVTYRIKPKFLIGSGLVELEEILEYSKMKSNNKLFNILSLLAILSLGHFTYKILFVHKDPKDESKK